MTIKIRKAQNQKYSYWFMLAVKYSLLIPCVMLQNMTK